MVPRRQQNPEHRRQHHRAKRHQRSRVDQRRKTRHPLHSRDVQKDLPRVDDEHLRLVHLPATLVGPPHPRLALQTLRRNHRLARNPHPLRQLQLHRHRPGNRRPRHLVLLRPPSLHHPRLAGNCRTQNGRTDISLPTSPTSTPPPSSSPASTSSSSGSPA